MDEREPCPSEATLRNFLIGNLPDDEGIRIAIHVERCSLCEIALERLRESDPALLSVSVPLTNPGLDPLAVTRTHFTDPALLDQLDRPEHRFDYSLLGSSGLQTSLGRLGKYDVIRELGHGGYGVVFEGWDEQLHRAVAMKVLNRELGSSPVARRRFMREARAAAAINHPNVVTIHAVEEHAGIPFIVMELVTGGSLRDRIRNGPKPTIFEVLRIGWQIAAGLAAAHNQGVIHRDIKPGNVLLENGLERIKITDFGLARVTVEKVDVTSREIAVGTPTYMAPEQVAGANIDARSDLFSLGCVLYAMFVGHSPFHGRTALEVARKIADEDPPPLHVVDPAVPKFLSDIIQRLLAKSPEQRFQTASELADVLNHHLTLLNQTPTDELDAALRSAVYKPKKENWWRRAGWGGGALTACAGVLAMLWFLFFRPPVISPLDSQRGTTASSTPDILPLAQRKPIVTVSQSNPADTKSIADALQQVSPGGTIRVLDDAEYDEPIVIDSAQDLRGVSLIAEKGAVLSSSGTKVVMVIHETPAVTIRGFRFNVPEYQHGIEITGHCPGLLIEKIQSSGNSRRLETTNVGFIYFHEGASGTSEQPLVVRHLRLRNRHNFLVIGEQKRAEASVQHLVLDDVWMIGPNNSPGYHCVFFSGVEHVKMQNCVLANGQCGFSVASGENSLKQLRDITINHCTLYRLTSVIAWTVPVSDCDGISFSNNAIIQSDSLDFRELPLVSSSWFFNNWWESTGASSLIGPVAKTLPTLPVVSEDPADSQFLTIDLAKLQGQYSADIEIPGHAFNQPTSE